jgi:cytochrome d ubiquinol oxidase subunit I
LWIFGWDRLSPRLHLATLWVVVIGTWLSAYFILVANSFMQEPVGYKLVNGEAQLTSVWKLLSSTWALWAFGHTMLAGLTTGAALVFGVCCWQLARGRNVETFLPASKVALIVLVPVACVNMWFGSHFGIYEDLGRRGALGHRAAGVVLALPDRRVHGEQSDAEVQHRGP